MKNTGWKSYVFIFNNSFHNPQPMQNEKTSLTTKWTFLLLSVLSIKSAGTNK